MGKKLFKRSAAVVLMLMVLSTGIAASAQGTYTVEKDDYLKKIAQSVYGDSARWEDIYEANKDSIKNPDIIYKGQVLILPDVEPVPAENTEEVVTAGTVATLEQWVLSEECREAEELVNELMEDAGLAISLRADGNILVYEYTFIPGIWSELTAEEMKEIFGDSDFDDFMGSQQELVESLKQEFDTTYGIKLDGIRFVFFAPDGTPIYSTELKNQ